MTAHYTDEEVSAITDDAFGDLATVAQSMDTASHQTGSANASQGYQMDDMPPLV